MPDCSSKIKFKITNVHSTDLHIKLNTVVT